MTMHLWRVSGEHSRVSLCITDAIRPDEKQYKRLQNLFRALQMVKMINYSPFSNIGPLCLDVSVTSICNHNCYFCDEHSYLKTKGRKHETLPEPVLRNLFEDCVKLGVQEILLAGNGEPFFVKYLPKLIMEYGSKIKIKALTN